MVTATPLPCDIAFILEANRPPGATSQRGDDRLNAPDEDFMSMSIVELPAEKPRKRRKYRKYSRPECTDSQWRAILDLQQGRCAVCQEEAALMKDQSYRSGKLRGGLCRQCNCTSGMLKGSPTRIKRLLAYLANPPAKALGFGESEKEKVKP
jgi:Recombination endonuclease VII